VGLGDEAGDDAGDGDRDSDHWGVGPAVGPFVEGWDNFFFQELNKLTRQLVDLMNPLVTSTM